MAVASPDADAVIVPRRPIEKFDSTASGLLEIVPGEVDWIGFGQSTEAGLCHLSRQFDEQAESLFHVSTCSGRSGVRIIRGGAAAPCLTIPMRFPVS